MIRRDASMVVHGFLQKNFCLVNVMNAFCRECPECHRVFEYDDDDQFQEVSPGRSAAPSAY